MIDEPGRLPRSRRRLEHASSREGRLTAIACEQVGIASVVLGGGREEKEDVVDPAVGIELHKKVGDPVAAGEPLCTVYYNSDARLQEALTLLQRAFRVEPAPERVARPMVRQVIDGNT